MCGIIACINAGGYALRSGDFIANAILAGAVRGQDSTGILQTDRKGKVYTHKMAMSGSMFAEDKITLSFVKDTPKSRITVLHHRAATVGVITDENAHPFLCEMSDQQVKHGKHGTLAGVHNGSLTNWKSKPGAKDFNVDSNWALAHIAKNGIDAFKDITGPYCFMWTSTDTPHKLFVARNSGRPMHVVFTKDKKEAYFASEAGMLAWLCERNNIAIEDTISIVGTDTLYTFDTSGGTITVSAEKLPVVTAPVVYHPVRTPADNNHAPWTVDQINDAGRAFLDKIKLAAAGKLVASTAEVVTDVASSADDDEDDYVTADAVPEKWYSDRHATDAEKANAKKLGMFRELQWFQGVTYDDETGEVLGDIEVWEKGKGKVKYAGIIRGCSRARANSEYIKAGKNGVTDGSWVVIVGAREERQLGKVLIAAELTREGRAGLDKMYATN